MALLSNAVGRRWTHGYMHYTDFHGIIRIKNVGPKKLAQYIIFLKTTITFLRSIPARVSFGNPLVYTRKQEELHRKLFRSVSERGSLRCSTGAPTQYL